MFVIYVGIIQKNENPFMRYDGKCDEYHESVIKCYKLKKN